jgi:hypothetical protein
VLGDALSTRDRPEFVVRSIGPSPARKPYPSDVSDEEWSLVAAYLMLMSDESPQRDYELRTIPGRRN